MHRFDLLLGGATQVAAEHVPLCSCSIDVATTRLLLPLLLGACALLLCCVPCAGTQAVSQPGGRQRRPTGLRLRCVWELLLLGADQGL